jgi:DNA polymerase-3 subunit alpha
VRVAGTVESYRERVFRTGGKLAFFNLEDLRGGIEVKVRERELDRLGELFQSGEPLLVSGKLQFPFVEDADDAAQGPREPTLLLDEATLLSHAIAAETRSVAIRVGGDTAPDQLARLGEVLRASPGSCRVELIIDVEDGAQAVLNLRPELRVEPSDRMLASLERLFGSGVAELR